MLSAIRTRSHNIDGKLMIEVINNPQTVALSAIGSGKDWKVTDGYETIEVNDIWEAMDKLEEWFIDAISA